jgi:hypothetical protein
MKPPRRARWLVVALPAALALLCVIAGAFVWSRPRIPRTHHQNVRAALERRAIVYRGVELSQTYEESVEFDTYRAQVLVVMPDGRRVNGWRLLPRTARRRHRGRAPAGYQQCPALAVGRLDRRRAAPPLRHCAAARGCARQ